MLFEIKRTSDILGERPPCIGVIPAPTENGGTSYILDIRTLSELLDFVKDHGEIALRHEEGLIEGLFYVLEIRDLEDGC